MLLSYFYEGVGMSKKDIRICSVCRREHSFCPVCNPEDRNKPTFYFAFCSENCKNIYDVTSKYENGKMDEQTANEQLSKLDLSNKESFGESYRNTLKKISELLKETENIDVVEEISEDVSAEENLVVETDTAEDTQVSNKSFKSFSKKRGYKNVE